MYVAANRSYLYGITPEGQSLANDTLNQRTQKWQTWTASSVFVDNLKMSFFLAIPLVGLVVFLFVIDSTGQVIGMLAAATGMAPWLYIIGLILTPAGFFEIGAYALLGAEATYVLYLWLSDKDPVDRIKTQSWKSLLLYVTMLFATAWLEVSSV